jgi:stalled ribosome rescue protein Dom34
MSHAQEEQKHLQQVAIWVDHQEAVLAIFTDAHLLREEELFSNVGPHTHGGGWSQKHIEAHRHAILDHYYKEIVDNLNGVDGIIIYGPGQAKYELLKHIKHHKDLSHHVIDVVTTDKLSDHQFITMALYDLVSAQGSQKGNI